MRYQTTIRTPLLATVGAAALLAAGAAQAELSFNVGVFSDYIDNGESRSGNAAVVQGGAEFNHASGLFLGTQLSTLGQGQGQEVLPYVGFGTTLGVVDVELGYQYFYFPELEDADEGELFLGLGYGPVFAEVGYITNADDSDAEGSVVYELGAEYEFMPATAIGASVGYDDPNDDDGVTFWSLGLSRGVDRGEISLTYASRDERGSQSLFAAGYSISF